MTFPGPGRPPTATHVLVDHIPETDRQEDSSSEEVKRVIQLVIRPWRTARRSLTKKAGLRGFRFHDLRHCAITQLVITSSGFHK